MDAYTRAIRGWGISSSLDEELVVRALEKALEHYMGCTSLRGDATGIP